MLRQSSWRRRSPIFDAARETLVDAASLETQNSQHQKAETKTDGFLAEAVSAKENQGMASSDVGWVQLTEDLRVCAAALAKGVKAQPRRNLSNLQGGTLAFDA